MGEEGRTGVLGVGGVSVGDGHAEIELLSVVESSGCELSYCELGGSSRCKAENGGSREGDTVEVNH